MHSLLCRACGREYPFSVLYRCRSCGSSLEVSADMASIRKSVSLSGLRERPFCHARYREFYPPGLVSLGEGGTPLLRSRNLERELGLPFRLWFKMESSNPTGSFKDRGSSVEVAIAARALEGKHRRQVVVASTGNMGASLAAYSAAAGLECHVLTPRDAVPVKLMQMLACGARVHEVPGDYSLAARLAERAHEELGVHLLGDYLFRREGTKSLGFEMAEQLPGADWVFLPMGNGTLISATWKAYVEWRDAGLAKSLPRLAGIQASGCSPITRAFRTGRPLKPVKGRTVAVAIECGDPLDGDRALSAMRESGGLADTVSDRDILKARELLAMKEGIFAEPAGAVSLAGLIKARKSIPRGSSVVCVITGHGLKSPRTPIGGSPVKLKSIKDLRGLFKKQSA